MHIYNHIRGGLSETANNDLETQGIENYLLNNEYEQMPGSSQGIEFYYNPMTTYQFLVTVTIEQNVYVVAFCDILSCRMFLQEYAGCLPLWPLLFSPSCHVQVDNSAKV